MAKELKDYSDDVSHDGPIIDGFKGNKKHESFKLYLKCHLK